MPRASLWRRDRMNGRHIRGILQWLGFCSWEAQADAVAGNAKTGRNAALRMTATAQHADAARLRHGQQINGGDDRKAGERKNGRPFKGDRERERKHD